MQKFLLAAGLVCLAALGACTPDGGSFGVRTFGTAKIREHHGRLSAQGYAYAPAYGDWRHPSSEGGGGGYWNDLPIQRPLSPSESYYATYGAYRPDGVWVQYCKGGYAKCGRDSAANHQLGGSQS